MLRLAAALLVAACAPAPSLARTALQLDPQEQPIALQDAGDAWIDPSGRMEVEEVAARSDLPWQPTHADAIYALSTGRALWMRFTLPPTVEAERWYLEIPYPSVNRATLYSRDTTGQWIPASAGDAIAVADWPVPHRHPLLPLQLSPLEPRQYLLRVWNPHSFSAPLSFVSDSFLGLHEQRTSLVLGIYFGLVGLAVVLGALSAVSLRDSAFGWYTLSVAVMGLAQAAITGLGGLHLWPRQPAWNDLSPIVLPVLAVGSLQPFFASIISLGERSRLLDISLNAIGLAAIPVALAIVWAEPSHRFMLMVPYIVVATNFAFGIVIWAVRRGDRFALGLLAGMVPVLIGAAFPLARIAGLIPISFWTMHGMQVGIAIELPLLLVILALRSQHRRENIRRIHRIERIDPATGLCNAEVFHERLARMMLRCARLKYRSAVLMVEIVNTENVRRQFGARSAEELPLRVAGRLLSAAREIDTVARLSDLRFGMLVEGPLSDEDAASEGPRIVARCLMPFANKPIEWVAQVRVAQTLIPTERADARQVIDRLAALLANVSPESKRAVFTLTS